MQDAPHKIDQTEFGTYGNCRSACFAMLLGLDIKDVPNFEIGRDGMTLFEFNERMRDWLESHGVAPFCFDTWDGWDRYVHKDQYFMAIIPSDLGGEYAHCVVYKGSELFYDPMPDGKPTPKEVNQIFLLVSLRPDIAIKDYND